MIQKIIYFSIHNKILIGLFTLALILAGIYSMRTINLGSVPDITNNQVQVMTVSENLSTEDIEQLVTYPVELSMGNLPGVTEIRSISRFGLSVVTIVFEDDMGTYLPRQLVQEKLNEIDISDNVGQPSIGPISTGLGEIFQYSLEVDPAYDSIYSITELRTIQDWLITRQLTLVDGVVGVNAFGGKVKQYEIAIDPEKLNSLDISISQVYQALKDNNINTGGAYIEKNKMANFIRGEGLIRSLDDIRKIVISKVNGIPITIEDAASSVDFGYQIRYGAFTKDGEEAVGGMVLMLKGANPNAVINRVKNRIDDIQKSLPDGVRINPFLDRSELISRTTDTVISNLLEGALIVIFALVLLLGSLRGGIVTATTIPLSLLIAFILMKQFGVWANLMSLGAIDFGIIIDGAVIIIEGTVYEIQKKIKKGKEKFSQADMDALAYDSGSTMMNSAFFGQVIILIVFAPILFLTGIEGKMFRPMAFTFGFAIIGAIILCLTYVPMMSSLLMKPISDKNNLFGKLERGLESFSQKILNAIHSIYNPILKTALKLRLIFISLAFLLFVATLLVFNNLGGEFIPQLDEGDIAMQALIRPGSGLTESIETSEKIERLILDEFPEVRTVTARIGVADIPTDPMPMDIADMYIILDKGLEEWISAGSKKELIEKIEDHLNDNLVGVNLVFTQPVELRFNELLTGVREDVAVKLYGEDLDILSSKITEIAGLVRTIPGVGDVSPERVSGLPQMTIQYDRNKLAQYGVSIRKINEYISTAFAGGKAGVVFEGERRFDLVLRLTEDKRNSIEDIRSMYIDLENGRQIPIEELADIEYLPGPMQISRENTYRRTYVGVNTRDRDVESVVEDIQEKLKNELELPPGYYLSYGGEFENLKRAKSRLTIVVPIALFLIFVMLYFALNSLTQSTMIYIAIPLGAVGGVFALWLRDMPFSISAGVGFIVLFGVAVLNGLVLINRFNSLKSEGVLNVKERIFQGTKERLRPILLTATTDIFGFLPMAFSTSSGAEVQRPLATVVIGGMLTATILTLIVLPLLYYIIENRKSNIMNIKLNTQGMTLILLFCLSPFVFVGQNVQSPDTLKVTRSQAIEIAMESHPVLKISEMQTSKNQALRKSAWDFGRTQLFTSKEEYNSENPGVNTHIGIQQSNIDIFGIKPKLDYYDSKSQLASDKHEAKIRQMALLVSNTWNKCYILKEVYKVYEHLDSIYSRVNSAANIKFETEDISRLEYISLKSRSEEISLMRKQAFRDYRTSLEELNYWLENENYYEIEDSEFESPSGIDRQEVGIENIPELNVAESEIQLAKSEIKRVKAEYFPKLNAQYSLQSVNGVSGFNQFQLGVSFPLIFISNKGKVQASDINLMQSRENLILNEKKYTSELNQSYENYLKWKDSYDYYIQHLLPLAKEQRNGALISYKEGEIDYVSFLSAIQNGTEIEIKSLEVYLKYLNSYNNIKYYSDDLY